ncbi:unnamed protein product, partial [Polarella glacialis]
CAVTRHPHGRLLHLTTFVLVGSVLSNFLASSPADGFALPQGFARINELAERGEVEAAELLFDEVERRTPQKLKRMLVNTLIKACANAGLIERAELWH